MTDAEAPDASAAPDGSATSDASSEPPDASDAARDASGAASDAPADVALSDLCTMGKVSVTRDTLNPGDVYMFAEIRGAGNYLDITHWSDTTSACVGFPNLIGRSAMIRPTDGRLLYLDDQDGILREFHAESCGTPAASGYPAQAIVLANDTVVPTPMCATDGSSLGVMNFRFSPEGDLYYLCRLDQAWYDATGAKVYSDVGLDFDSVGRGKVAYIETGPPMVLDLATGNLTIVTAPDPFVNSQFVAVRARDAGGFWVARSPAGAGYGTDLWQVNPDGTGTKVGSYSATIPAGLAGGVLWDGYLDGCNGLLQIAHEGTPVSRGVVLRRDLSGASAIAYDDTNDPFVKVDAYLVTGP
jgi:hypothetical protein